MSVKPTSIQPGGGCCMSIELGWGHWRRACLRRFRPGYVRRMALLRQGDCPNCPHDIIDSRDLKYYRNVCGFWFHPHDDAFRWRDRLRLARAGLAELILFSMLCAVLAAGFAVLAVLVHWLSWLVVGAAFLMWAEVVFFFRDPDRPIPSDPKALLSPADGTVTHVGVVGDPDFPGGAALRISIFLSVFNVHVNRNPRSGKVADVRYFPGAFLDARHSECAVRNEQLWIDLLDKETEQPIRIKQISGAIARRIVCWLKAGEDVKAGERLGMIKFGSRTDILVVNDGSLLVSVNVGDKVKGGSTIIGRFDRPTNHSGE